jgi:hypothetical protein
MSIKAGTSVVINLDPTLERLKPLKALVYDVMGKRLILSQTSPPIPSPPSKSPLFISYTARKGDSVCRFGFSAVVSGFGDDYELSSGERVPTLVVDMKHEPEEASLRKGFRIRTPSNSGLSLTIGGKNYRIFDISLTGVNFIQSPAQPPFKPSYIFECRLNIDGQGYPLKARVVRVSETTAARRIAAAFTDVGMALQSVLSRKILLLERKELSGQGRSD